jgi:hypothetical protein
MIRTLAIFLVALALAGGCSRAKSVHGTWVGTYTPGDISPNDFDIVAHEEFATVTHGKLVLEMKDGGEFELKTVGSVKGRWDIDGNTVTLVGRSTSGKDLPGVDLVLSKDGTTLSGRPEKDGTKLTFKKQG